jgi:hypothetical protein
VSGAAEEPPCIVHGSEIAVPAALDPQYPLCLFELARFLDGELPEVVAALSGRSCARVSPGTVRVWVLGKGCFVEPAATPPPDQIGFVLGLNGPMWPVEWGGHVEVLAGEGEVLTPGRDCLDLIAHPYRVPLITRHISVVMVTGTLQLAS